VTRMRMASASSLPPWLLRLPSAGAVGFTPTAKRRLTAYTPDLSDHSALMPDSLIIGHHFLASAFCKAASASGVRSSRGKT